MMMMIWEGYNLSKGVNKNTYLILSELNCALVGWLDRREKEGGRESKGRECVANCWGIHAVGRVPGSFPQWEWDQVRYPIPL